MENAGTKTARPELLTFEQELAAVAAADAKFPAEFGLRGYPGKTFRVSPTASYYSIGLDRRGGNKSPAGVQVYTQIEHASGEWLDFAKGTVAELLRELAPSPRYEARRIEIEKRAAKFASEFDSIDEQVFDLDERRRKLGTEFDAFSAGAADDLDDEDFEEIFGTEPDRSNRPETKDEPAAEAPRPAPYERTILDALDALGIDRREYNPRHIEAFLRGRFGTLDALSVTNFRRAVKVAVQCIDAAGPETAEEISQSHGL